VFKQQPGEQYGTFCRRLQVMLAVARGSLASILRKRRAAALRAVATPGCAEPSASRLAAVSLAFADEVRRRWKEYDYTKTAVPRVSGGKKRRRSQRIKKQKGTLRVSELAPGTPIWVYLKDHAETAVANQCFAGVANPSKKGTALDVFWLSKEGMYDDVQDRLGHINARVIYPRGKAAIFDGNTGAASTGLALDVFRHGLVKLEAGVWKWFFGYLRGFLFKFQVQKGLSTASSWAMRTICARYEAAAGVPFVQLRRTWTIWLARKWERDVETAFVDRFVTVAMQCHAEVALPHTPWLPKVVEAAATMAMQAAAAALVAAEVAHFDAFVDILPYSFGVALSEIYGDKVSLSTFRIGYTKTTNPKHRLRFFKWTYPIMYGFITKKRGDGRW
jgi:hypothetical protein